MSERESEIIAARLVRRLRAKTKLTPDQEKNLRVGFEETIRSGITSDARVDLEEIGKQLLAVSQEFLAVADVALVREIIARGYDPQAGEE